MPGMIPGRVEFVMPGCEADRAELNLRILRKAKSTLILSEDFPGY